MRRRIFVATITLFLLCGAILLCASLATDPFAPQNEPADAYEMPVDLDRGAGGLSRCLSELRTRASILMITAHPDDEDGGLLAYETRGIGARGILLTLNRGEGGQNAMSNDFYDALGLLRTQELVAADRYYGVDQYWTSVIDYGFSKTSEEALAKWGHDRVLGEVVRVIRMTRPLVIASVFTGAPTDGHGNHEVAGQVTQEAFVAAGDPKRFPEQLREGLHVWSPLKVYEHVPFFQPSKDGIYDYATDKFVPVRFYDYVTQKWIDHPPGENVSVPEGVRDPAVGLTFFQMGRNGLGQQKSQNGGVTIPPPSVRPSPYHRYGSRVEAPDHESSMYDGIDISLEGIASLATGDTGLLRKGLAEIARIAGSAASTYRPNDPIVIAPQLAQGLAATRALLRQVRDSNLPEPGKDDVAFEIQVKERQFATALAEALQLSFNAFVAPEKEPPPNPFASPPNTFTIAVPGQSFAVSADLYNQGSDAVGIENIDLAPTDGKTWTIHATGSPASSMAAGTEMRLRFQLKAPEDAVLTRPYFSRPNQEQPYYDLNDPRYENLSFAPYPLVATARIVYRGTELSMRKYVFTRQRVEGIGQESNPLLIGPPLSIQVSPAAGAVPLDSKSFAFSCTLHSNVKGVATGVLRLHLPQGWSSVPAEYPYSMQNDGDTQTVNFNVSPHDIHSGDYQIKAIAEYQGKNYEEGYRLVSYPGARPYPYYRPAVFKAVGVDVKTAPALHVAFVPGTGDEVPRALEDLRVPVRVISASDLETTDLSDFDAVILGVRAYSIRPELRDENSHLLAYVKNGGVLIVQYNLGQFDYGPYPTDLGSNPAKVVDEASAVKFLHPDSPVFNWPNKITPADFSGWEEERGHGFLKKWDPRYEALVETHDPDQPPQESGLLLARYGKGIYIYDAFALYRQLPAGVPGAYRILANLVSAGKNPGWQ
jgi:LmbE family N-acetylglucosaminyl deacetylase